AEHRSSAETRHAHHHPHRRGRHAARTRRLRAGHRCGHAAAAAGAPAGNGAPMTEETSHRLPGLDLERLREYLDDACPGLVQGPLSGSIVQGGRSNLTYVVDD